MGNLAKVIRQVNRRNIQKAFGYMQRYGIRGFYEACTRRAVAESSYQDWFVAQRVTEEELREQRGGTFAYMPLISIIVPTYNTPENFLREMIESVRGQSYTNWELCIADGSTGNQRVRDILQQYVESDARIRCTFLENNMGIAANTNAALQMAKGDYIGLLDHDDLLEANALYEIVKAMQIKRAGMIYSDEDKISSDGQKYMEPNFKPDFDIELLRSCNYITHFLVIKRKILDTVGGLRSGFDGAQDYDLIFRCEEIADSVMHVPQVLYHWRVNAESTAEQLRNKQYCLTAGKHAIEAHLNRLKICAAVDCLGNDYAFYHTRYVANDENNISVVSTPDELKNASGKYLLFLSKDLMQLSADAVSEMIGICEMSNVGAVGGKIISKDNRIIHAGIFCKEGGKDDAVLAFYGSNAEQMGYLGRARLNAQCDAVLTDCLLIRREVFEQIGREFPWNIEKLDDKIQASVDFCKAIKAQEYKIVYSAFSVWKYQKPLREINKIQNGVSEFTRFGRMYEY